MVLLITLLMCPSRWAITAIYGLMSVMLYGRKLQLLAEWARVADCRSG